LALEFILDSLWNIEISADPIRHTEEEGDVVRQVRPTEQDVGIEINTFEWLLAHRMIFADKAPIRMKSRDPPKTSLARIGLIYDVAGNVTKDNLGNTITHDAEDRIATIAGFTYSYDADGMRMEKTSGSSGTMYWRGVWGTLVETDLTGSINEEYVYFNGLRIARVDRPSGTVHYYFSNHLGSHTVVTSATGSCEQDIDYYPYGGEQHEYCATPVAQNYKFTGKERDSESGLDNFGARFEASSLGRFMTPDWAARPISVPYATFGDPQTLNLYSYVENAPLNRIDADGHEQHQAGDVEAACANGAANCTMSANNQQFTGQAQNTQVKIRVPGTTITVTATIGMSDSERALFSLALGHHGLPRALFRFLPRGAARTWLEREFVTGPLQGKHYYDAAHRAYNEAVQDLLKLRTEEGEADVAKEVMRAGQRILDSDNPAIKGFLDNMTTADGMTGREALGRALAGDGEAFGEFAAGAVGEVVMGAAEAP
jgi:RHS repeat-associated protein